MSVEATPRTTLNVMYYLVGPIALLCFCVGFALCFVCFHSCLFSFTCLVSSFEQDYPQIVAAVENITESVPAEVIHTAIAAVDNVVAEIVEEMSPTIPDEPHVVCGLANGRYFLQAGRLKDCVFTIGGIYRCVDVFDFCVRPTTTVSTFSDFVPNTQFNRVWAG